MGKLSYKLRPETLKKYGEALSLLYNQQNKHKGGKYSFTPFIIENKLNTWFLQALKNLNLVDSNKMLKTEPHSLTAIDVCNEINRLLYTSQDVKGRASYIKKGRDIRTNTILSYLKDNEHIKPEHVYVKVNDKLIPITKLIGEWNPEYK